MIQYTFQVNGKEVILERSPWGKYYAYFYPFKGWFTRNGIEITNDFDLSDILYKDKEDFIKCHYKRLEWGLYGALSN